MMATRTINFTVRTIEAIKPPKKDRDTYKDQKVPGLYLRVSSTGTMSFSCLGRPRGGGEAERETIGRFPELKPEEARAIAISRAGERVSGTSTAQRVRDKRNEMTLEQLYLKYRAWLELKGQSTEAIDGSWKLYIAPTFAKKRLSAITSDALEVWHRKIPEAVIARAQAQREQSYAKALAHYEEVMARRAIRRRGPPPRHPSETLKAPPPWKGHRTANIALEKVRVMFNWATDKKRKHYQGENPAAGLDMFPEHERDRFIYPEEMSPFFRALAEEPNEVVRDFILIALLSGARRGNVLSMKWSDIDLVRAEWRVPGELMKNGNPQTITLVPEAIELLKERLQSNQRQAALEASNKDPNAGWLKALETYVFPSPKSEAGHIVDPRKPWTRVLSVAKLSNLRLHDLRRTLGSWQIRTGSSLVHVSKALNHLSLQATEIYARLDLDPIRHSLELATSAMLKAAGLKDSADILPLRTKATSVGGGSKQTA